MIRRIGVFGEVDLYANCGSVPLLWRTFDLFGGRSINALASDLKVAVSTALAIVRWPWLQEASMPIPLNEAIREVSALLSGGGVPDWGLVDRGAGCYLSLMTAKSQDISYIVRFALAPDSRRKLERNALGMVAFGMAPGIRVPRLVRQFDVGSVHVTVETALNRPLAQCIGKPTAALIAARWNDVVTAMGQLGPLMQSGFYDDVIHPLTRNVGQLPNWLVDWIHAGDWKRLAESIGLTPLGPVHGDLDNKNCWLSGNNLCIVDFDRSLDHSPMYIDLVRLALFGDLRRDDIGNKVDSLSRDGSILVAGLSGELAALNSNIGLRRHFLLLTLLYEYAAAVRQNYPPMGSEVRPLLDAIRHFKN